MNKPIFLSVIGIVLVCYLLNQYLGQMPAVKPADAPESEFSAGRAMDILAQVLAQGEPHPVGSDANHVVKNNILGWLDKQGIKAEVQAGWGCSRQRNNCAWVENIVATIPGQTRDEPYLALMAHYDSVPKAPGAGDDGAGFATVLEVGRMLHNEGPFKNTVLLVITDAEENGLLGAEAFFANHADNIGLVVNVEGSGSSGPSRLLRTTMANGSFLEAYAQQANFPQGQSFVSEVFKRMPNDTDFSVSQRANIPGIDFAFAGERNHYHTANDNLANLDPRSLQHHGENILPVARKMANADLDHLSTTNLVYSKVYGQLVRWPTTDSIYLAIFSLLLLVVVLLQGRVKPLNLLLSIFSPLLYIVAISIVLLLNFKLISWLNGTTVAWPAHDLPFRLVLFSSSALAAMAVANFLNRWLSQLQGLLGVWIFWAIVAITSTIYVPAAANLFILPLLFAALLLALSPLIASRYRLVAQLLTVVMVVPGTLGLALDFEITQGYQLIASTFLFLALFAASIGPFIRGRVVNRMMLATLLISVGGTIGAVSLPLYSDLRPQLLNLYFIEDTDQQTAFWQARSPNPIPARLKSKFKFDSDLAIYPWSGQKIKNLSPAEFVAAPRPSFKLLQRSEMDDGKTIVRAELKSERQANWLALVFPARSSLQSFKLAGVEYKTSVMQWNYLRDQYVLWFSGIQHKTIDLELSFNGEIDRAYLMEGSSDLPDNDLEQLRSPLALPVHGGDQNILIREVSLRAND